MRRRDPLATHNERVKQPRDLPQRALARLHRLRVPAAPDRRDADRQRPDARVSRDRGSAARCCALSS